MDAATRSGGRTIQGATRPRRRGLVLVGGLTAVVSAVALYLLGSVVADAPTAEATVRWGSVPSAYVETNERAFFNDINRAEVALRSELLEQYGHDEGCEVRAFNVTMPEMLVICRATTATVAVQRARDAARFIEVFHEPVFTEARAAMSAERALRSQSIELTEEYMEGLEAAPASANERIAKIRALGDARLTLTSQRWQLRNFDLEMARVEPTRYLDDARPVDSGLPPRLLAVASAVVGLGLGLFAVLAFWSLRTVADQRPAGRGGAG